MNTETNFSCSGTIEYDTSQGICVMEFYEALSASHCSQNIADPFLVLNDAMEEANQLLNLLDYLASDDCKSEVVPFLCLHLFGLCSSSGDIIQPTSSQCKEIRDSLCQTEWDAALKMGFNLPDCNDFPQESGYCLNLSASNMYLTGKV